MRQSNPALRLVIGLITSLVLAQSKLDTAQIAEKLAKSVVTLRGSGGGVVNTGSGFIISSDGKIVSNLHVVRDMNNGGVQLATGEMYHSFTILAFDELRDLAILQIAGFDLPAVELGNSNNVRVAEPVLAIGGPLGLQGTVTSGIVSALRDVTGGGSKLIQTDAATNPGNSGGPLVNGRGQVIGVITFKLSESEGLNFAVPINYVRGLLGALQRPMSLSELKTKLVTRGFDPLEDRMSPYLVSGSSASTDWGDSNEARATLRGLRGFFVRVSGPASDSALTEAARTNAELKLRKSGILVLTESEATLAPGGPTLNIDFDLFNMTVLVRMSQWVRLERNSTIRFYSPTWGPPPVSFLQGSQADPVRLGLEKAGALVDRFVNAWLTANPKN